MFTFSTRAGTWGIASSHEPAGDGAASCLMATAYPAVVLALLWGNELVCGSSKKKNSDMVIAITCFLRVKCMNCPTHYLTKAIHQRRSGANEQSTYIVSKSTILCPNANSKKYVQEWRLNAVYYALLPEP
ncbi:hypothetical protein CSV78_15185 [Sporosarcina sp. P16a]|nr:hypothetical protein CSV78_15185 [Sporosarcina sp. P16a]PIC92022.1 hypothetical protein CSV70_12840 [Sporosarcina sp. P25]